MNFDNIYLNNIAYADPDEFLSSDRIEGELAQVYEKLKLPFGRIEMQTGIKSRGIYQEKLPSDIATLAARNLFEGSNIKPNDIDLLIFASVCRDFLEPSTASVVHDNLKLKQECLSFDLSNACLGVVNAIGVAAKMLESSNLENALIVTGENATPLITKTIEKLKNDPSLNRKSIKKFFANFTIGSAGVALIVSKNKDSLAKIISSQSLTDSSANKLCQGSGSMDGLVMETNSEVLKEKGVSLARMNWLKFNEEKINWDHYICHQVGIHHQEYLYKMLELDITKDFSSFEKYGNTGSAALPLTLALAKEKNIFKSNDEIALLGIGSGLHTTMMRIKWN